MDGATFHICFVTYLAKELRRKDFHQRNISMGVMARDGTKAAVTKTPANI